MADKVHLVIHINSHLLIVVHKPDTNWIFRIVSPSGERLQEQTGFTTEIEAEKAGRTWLDSFLQKDPYPS